MKHVQSSWILIYNQKRKQAPLLIKQTITIIIGVLTISIKAVVSIT